MGGIRPVDIAIGDGKNVSVNVTALSVPFSPVKGHHHRLPDTLESASSVGHRHDIKLQYTSTHTHTHTHCDCLLFPLPDQSREKE